MNDLPENLFANPAWHALQTTHRHLAVSQGQACRYPSDVAPFAALAAPSPAALRELRALLATGESVWLIAAALPPLPQIAEDETMDCLQMVLPKDAPPPPLTAQLAALGESQAQEMVALTDLAFPGFFRRRTHVMGAYFGIRSGGELIAMGGERLMLEGYAEISGICTHPAHRGRGFAASVIGQLVQRHRRQKVVSWLQVGAANRRAIDLYRHIGFEPVRHVTLRRLRRIA